jgi:hypothetical protein
MARLRAHGATRFPLGKRDCAAVHPLLLSRSCASGRRDAADLPVARIGARDTRYRPAMARRTAARLLPLPQCPHSPADTPIRPERAPLQLTWQVTGSVSHVSDRASRRSGPAGKALTVLPFGAAGAAGPATWSRGGCTRRSTRGRRAILNDLARQGDPRQARHSSSLGLKPYISLLDLSRGSAAPLGGTIVLDPLWTSIPR